MNIKLKLTSQDNTESGTIGLTFEESEISILKSYVKNCERLEKAKIFKGKFPTINNINWTAEKGLNIDIPNVEYSSVCELLHLARPILLQKEPSSFHNTQAIFNKQSKGTLLSKHLKAIREVYDKGHYQSYFQVTIGDTPLFDDKTLKLWLNGIEYHQDSDKAIVIEGLQDALSENTTRGLFVAQLSGKIEATFKLLELANSVNEKKG